MNWRNLPELSELDSLGRVIRLPDQQDVPLTPRVQRLLDTPAFQRLGKISQLGLVGLVYPAARHARLEHSLGVYRMALAYLKRMASDPRFAGQIDVQAAETLTAAALLHDVGHWPFCHPIEDMGLPDVPAHEDLARRFLLQGEIAEALREDWETSPEEVADLLTKKRQVVEPTQRILRSMLSGPIDIDKMDYLMRDSLHAGVPYGRNFDQSRLIGGLCLNEAGDALAIRDKGRTAAEMMVFARYVMFSEVYWHHAVRSATAMLQRAFYLTHQRLDLGELFTLTEEPWTQRLRDAADGPAGELLEGVFGARRLYKRWAQFSVLEQSELHRLLARRPYPWLARCGGNFAELLGAKLGRAIAPHEILFDAPPMKLEVECNVEIYFPKENRYRLLAEVSPMVQTLARRQFDNYVKRVRLFAHPRLADSPPDWELCQQTLHEAIERTEAGE